MAQQPHYRNLQEAIRAQDRSAIREIMARNQALRDQAESEILLPESAQSCVNSEDYISLERWSSDYLPNVYIRYMDHDQRIGAPMCYRKDDLLQLAETLEHAWVIPYINPGLYLDEDGKVRSPYNSNYKGYGEPSQVERFVRVPPAYYLEYNSFIEALETSDSLLAIPIYQTRVGNAEGSYGESRSHGQGDVTVYYVVETNAFESDPERMYNEIYRKVYKMKTEIPLSNSLTMIQQLQVDFPVAKKDRELYHLELSPDEYGTPISNEEEEEEELLPKITPENLNQDTILEVMYDWIVDPPPNREKAAKIFEGVYKQYLFFNKVIEFKEGEFLDTATFVDRNTILEPGFVRILTIDRALGQIWHFLNRIPISLDQEIQEIMGAQNNFVLGGMLLLFNDIFTTSGIVLWLNTQAPLELDRPSLFFGNYEIPELTQNIYDVVLGSIFEASRINTEHYQEIKYWTDWPLRLSMDEVINFILSYPAIRNQFFTRYYLHIYNDINIGELYDMFYLLFETGYQIDLGDTIEIRSSGAITNIKDLIEHYQESTLLMAYAKQPKLQDILDELNEHDLINQAIYYINDRLRVIRQYQTVRFVNRFKYSGISELDENYQAPDITDSTLLLMFYTDPAFAELIGPVPLTEGQIQIIQDAVGVFPRDF